MIEEGFPTSGNDSSDGRKATVKMISQFFYKSFVFVTSPKE
jgi:hypothetical protein